MVGSFEFDQTNKLLFFYIVCIVTVECSPFSLVTLTLSKWFLLGYKHELSYSLWFFYSLSDFVVVVPTVLSVYICCMLAVTN